MTSGDPRATSRVRRTAKEQILDRVRSVLRGPLARSMQVDADTDLQRDLQLDSLERITLLIELENEFEVCLELEEMSEEIRRLSDLVDILEKALQRPEAQVNLDG